MPALGDVNAGLPLWIEWDTRSCVVTSRALCPYPSISVPQVTRVIRSDSRPLRRGVDAAARLAWRLARRSMTGFEDEFGHDDFPVVAMNEMAA